MGAKHGLLIAVTLLFASLAESRTGSIISFVPPDPNDWLVSRLTLGEIDITSSYTDGVLVRNNRLDLYSIRLERYCRASNDVPRVTQAEWFDPPPMLCTSGYYHVLMVQYDEATIDCLRVNTDEWEVAMSSIKPMVIKRFALKVYYLTTSGDCYLKYFDLPTDPCSEEGYIRMPIAVCEEQFQLTGPESSSYYSDSVKIVASP